MKTMHWTDVNKQYSSLRSRFYSVIGSMSKWLERDILSHPSFEGKIVFGPVQSRRLGSSLGVNNIKHKLCTYNCIYCQSGETTCCSKERNCCLSPYELYFFVKNRIEELENNSIPIDYISFVPNGEPTLDDLLSTEISLLREFGYKIAVFTNGSLLWNERVKETLMFADHISIKIDTANEETWHRLNRPHRTLHQDLILESIADFSQSYQGILTTETMLVKGMNDTVDEMQQLNTYLRTVKRDASYFGVPIRPPTETFAVSPDPLTMKNLTRYITEHIPGATMLCCPEIDTFTALGNIEEELLGIMAVQPLSEISVEHYLRHHGESTGSIERLLNKGLIHRTVFQDKVFFVSNHQQSS